MSARGIPAQDEYPEWVQLKPAQEDLDPDHQVEAPKKRAAKKAATAEPVEAVEEAPVVEEPAEATSAE